MCRVLRVNLTNVTPGGEANPPHMDKIGQTRTQKEKKTKKQNKVVMIKMDDKTGEKIGIEDYKEEEEEDRRQQEDRRGQKRREEQERLKEDRT